MRRAADDTPTIERAAPDVRRPTRSARAATAVIGDVKGKNTDAEEDHEEEADEEPCVMARRHEADAARRASMSAAAAPRVAARATCSRTALMLSARGGAEITKLRD